MRRIKKKRLWYAASFLVFVAAVGVLVYPFASDWIYRYTARIEISDYDAAVARQDADRIQDMKQQAEAYNELLGGEREEQEEKHGDGGAAAFRPFSVASYNDLLALTDAIGYLEIPKLNVYLPIYHGLDDRVLQKGIGHMPESSLPVGGASSHCVLSGHSGLPAAKMLTDLDQVEEGDIFLLHVLDDILAYEVDQILVVLPDDTSALEIEKGKDYVTLLTCTPYGINTHRLLVRGERTKYTPKPMALKAPANAAMDESTVSPVILVVCGTVVAGVLVLVIFLLILFLPEREKQRKKE